MYQDDATWEALASFEFDEPGARLTFSKRLARENGWSHAFAKRAIEEYRRFVYLMVTAKHPVTPSVEVDQVWHLHLTYTRSYWDEMCGRVLGRRLHHGPTRGGSEEGAKYTDWYTKTLAAYEATFGEAPPSAFWPSPETRMSEESLIRNVSTRTHFVLPKPDVRAGFRRLWGALGVSGAALTASACSESEASLGWALFIVAATVAIVILYVLWVSWDRRGPTRRRDQGSYGDSGCSTYVFLPGSSDSSSGAEPSSGGSSSWWSSMFDSSSGGGGWGGSDSSSGGDSGGSDSSSGGDAGCGGGGCGGCGGD
jgi:hypothetical protein